MRIALLTQPFDAENLPSRLGDILIAFLNSQFPLFNYIWVVSAFANQQAVLHLLPHIKTAIEKGANVQIVIGIDHQATSIEALQEILTLGIDAKIAHNNQPGHTFHPKIYLFEAEGEKAELIVGSNNLTVGGLFTNYEVASQITFYFPEDEHAYVDFKRSLDRFLNPPESIVQPLTESLLENLIARGEIVSERQRQGTTAQVSVPRTSSPDRTIPPSLFGNESIPKPSSVTKKGAGSTSTGPVLLERGPLVWEKKNLPASDVERSPKGNPIGGLKLTQASWIVNDKRIDQTKYFRFDVFGKLPWEHGLKHEDQEVTEANFNVGILGDNYGIYTLMISHKPGGEAGQGNYTTKLHWGELSNTIRDLNLEGRTFRLYAPVEGSDIFTIEIV